jgi:hypothetical protein
VYVCGAVLPLNEDLDHVMYGVVNAESAITTLLWPGWLYIVTCETPWSGVIGCSTSISDESPLAAP